MIDITRLLFDDGAERPALQAPTTLPDVYFTFKGKRYVGRYVADARDRVEERAPNVLALYGPEHRDANSSWYGINRLLKDPENAIKEWRDHSDGPGEYDTFFQDLLDDNIIWYQFEELP